MAAGSELRVVVADDQRVIRDGLELLLGLVDGVTVVATAADGLAAVAAVAEHAPDVVLMDLRMPRCDGVEATRRVRAEYPGTQVVVLTTYADDADILAALRAGARGYLTKDAGVEEITRALRRVAGGQADLDPDVQRKLLELIPGEHLRAPVAHDLTDREVEVLRLIAQGLSNPDIAGRLFISEATVKTHVNHIFAKLEVRDRAQAVAYAFRQGIV
ncbi:response regulator transcription factor [Longispora sp. NPDC051575]|uniref:response regulator transcription factor n=1 Tax=Longispora sp. NPDC051575 TaxID=3154943 RepID=UPI00343C0A69